MTIYRNKNWTRRDYECTNIVFQVADSPRNLSTGAVDNENWIAVDAQEVADYAELGINWLEAQGVMKVSGIPGACEFWGYA